MTEAVAELVHVMIERALRMLSRINPDPFREAPKLNMMDSVC